MIILWWISPLERIVWDRWRIRRQILHYNVVTEEFLWRP